MRKLKFRTSGRYVGPARRRLACLTAFGQQRRRDREESKLRKDVLDKLEVYETWADRLELKAGGHTISYNRDGMYLITSVLSTRFTDS